MAFPDALKLEPELTRQSSIMEEWQYLQVVRRWLWANRRDFRYDDETRGYVLKAGDLYDSDNPPRLPGELRGPPRPTDQQVRASAAAARADEIRRAEEKIRTQIAVWDHHYRSWLADPRRPGRLRVPHAFPDLRKLIRESKVSTDVEELRTWLKTAREWLWANRQNLSLDRTKNVFNLRGPDLYDPDDPPELPEELRGPPRPTEEQIRAGTEAARRAELGAAEREIRRQVAEWDRYYTAWLSTRRGPGRFYVRRAFPDLQKLIGEAKNSADPQEIRTWLRTAREWLWANRENLRREGYVFRLRGPDLYDPENPPELPEDLRGPSGPGVDKATTDPREKNE
jgi:hypothetical protein